MPSSRSERSSTTALSSWVETFAPITTNTATTASRGRRWRTAIVTSAIVPAISVERERLSSTRSAATTTSLDAGRPPRINSLTSWPVRVPTVTTYDSPATSAAPALTASSRQTALGRDVACSGAGTSDGESVDPIMVPRIPPRCWWPASCAGPRIRAMTDRTGGRSRRGLGVVDHGPRHQGGTGE